MGYKMASEKRKRMIADSFKRIVQHKSFSKITVKEIIDDCGINRKTFYYHFEDMYALLKWTLEQEAIEIVKQFDLLVEHEEALLFIMDYIDQNDALLNNICDSTARGELKRFFYTDFIDITQSIIDKIEKSEHLSVSKSYKTFLERFYTEALAGILLDWITNPSTRNREETIQYISTVLHSTIPNALHAGALL